MLTEPTYIASGEWKTIEIAEKMLTTSVNMSLHGEGPILTEHCKVHERPDFRGSQEYGLDSMGMGLGHS
jgi:hypothetical protein